ncbi:hypothetical protein Tco_0248974 [Tanacetum coccineum]
MKVCGGGRCGRKGGMEDVCRVENVIGGSDDGGSGMCCKSILCIMGTKSTPFEVGWWKEEFIFHVIVDWESLASDLLKCGK